MDAASQIGAFRIPRGMIRQDLDKVRLLLRDIAITRAETRFATDSIEYEGIGAVFDPIEPGSVPPRYEWELRAFDFAPDAPPTVVWKRAVIAANDTIRIEWRGTNRTAECPPDPRWPDGKTIDASEPGRPSCTVHLPYPAPCIGAHVVICDICGMKIGCTAAGRPDDPVSITFNCKRPAVPHG